jgi:signal peptidase I
VAKKKEEGGFGETVKVIVQALLIALVVRTLLFQPFNIPSGSLIPTLLIGDYLFVSKYSYGYSKHSLPFSPDVFSGRIMASDPKRGDIAVFKLPRDGSTDYIKRVIGLPGDTVEVKGGQVHVNGVALDEPYLQQMILRDEPARVVEAGRYFVLGDNRNNSSDSRSFGTITPQSIVGRAWLVYWPPSDWSTVPHHTYAALSTP